jgi:dihydrofolate reductase
MFKQKAFLQHIKLEGGEENNIDNNLIEQTFSRIGTNIMGKRMFEEGEANWPEETPFHCPVNVLTHEKREPWERKGGTTFYFINDGIKSAFKKVKVSASNKDIRISGGADTIRQFLKAGLIEEFDIHLSPIMLRRGIRLFDKVIDEKFSFEITNAIHSPSVIHLYYKVINN